MSDFFDSLPPAERRLIDAATELREAREAAQQAARSGDYRRMNAAFVRLVAANATCRALKEKRRS